MIRLSALNKVRTVAVVAAAGLAAAACTSPVAGSRGMYAQPIGSAPVIANPTPYSPALYCLADWARANGRPSPRIAVGRIADYTGQVGENGRVITQGASLMAITALGKAGARQVERYDTSVSEMEMRYSGAMILGEGEAETPGGPAEPRRLIAGSVPGSDYVIQGGVTEVNFNIRNTGAEVGGQNAGQDDPSTGGLFQLRWAVMNVALDLRVVDTRTQEIVDVISYQKQLIGREVSLGVFDFLNGNTFDLSAGTSGHEPVQLAVRALVERAVLEIMANLYGAPGPEACLAVSGDPLFGTVGPTGGYYPAYDNIGTNNAGSRADPSRWHDRRDRDVRGSRY
ncbi:holdfast anchoring protein HfaB [Brevundimonas sp.]|uniref:holdfast anchoring protein HfaB n=1 Tax=Brevundimonas sp. TaxID=1871086 RepID=UPI002600BA85|nr:holdfast anchoring protein HfaB [Brevundimonas sp.]